jgi:hypothetical protein
VEPDQGNGENSIVLMQCGMTDIRGSSLTYHLAAATRCRPESGCAADFHSGTEEYAGEDHKVRIYILG